MSGGPRIRLVVDVELADDALAVEVEALRAFVARRIGQLEMSRHATARVTAIGNGKGGHHGTR